jgi:hypothetical protein
MVDSIQKAKLRYKQQLSAAVAARLETAAAVGSQPHFGTILENHSAANHLAGEREPATVHSAANHLAGEQPTNEPENSQPNGETVRALAYRIRACNQNQNLFAAADLHNAETGELYAGRGSLWCCGSRFCSNCVGRLARRSAKIAEFVFANQPAKPFHDWRFVVFTMPDNQLAGLPLTAQRAVLYHAWRWLSTKSEFWKKKVAGSIKSEEFTISAERANVFHFHSNALVFGYFLDEKLLKIEWTRALKISFARFGIAWHCPTKNGLADVQITRVSKSNFKQTVSELCKYITKPQDWQKIPAAALADVAGNPRFFRAFELQGVCRTVARAIRPNQPETAPQSQPAAANRQPDFQPNADQNAYVHTKQIIVPNFLLPPERNWKPPPRPRRKSWFLRISAGEITANDYKTELSADIENAIYFRKAQLRAKFPFAEFETLSGETF